MKVVVPSSSFATGIDVEEQSFTWAIDNFPLIRMQQSMIDSQKIEFTVGTTTGHPSQWTIYLMEYKNDEGKRWVGIYFSLKSPNPTDPTLKSSSCGIQFAIKDKEGKIIKNVEDIVPKHIATKFVECPGWGRNKFIDADDADICPEETLVIHITFKLYTPSQPKAKSNSSLDAEAIMEKFQVTFSERLRKDLSDLRKNPVPSTDIKIISRDKKEFSMPRRILAVRSVVLAAMLSSDMLEANSGVIDLPDISSKPLEVLLNFLCTGELDPDWSHAEVVVELTNAAAKYQLPDLLQFLDAMLGNVCKVENVLELFTLTHQLELKTAEVELSKYIHAQSISPEKCCEMLKGIISFPGSNESVHEHSLPKRKSRVWKLLSGPFKGF